jgi:hypothetical protein
MSKRFVAGFVLSVLFASAQFSTAQAQPPTGYTLVFDEEFNGPLDVAPGSGWGDAASHHKWTCHTPYGGDFGDTYFSGPQDGKGPNGQLMSPFSINNGVLAISAWVDPTINHWRSGLLSSMDWAGQGFAQTMGYYECRMKMPSGMGTWPAFWLDGVPGIFKGTNGSATDTIEIDVCEFYGGFPTTYHTNVHLWNSTNPGGGGSTINTVDLTQNFHVYGCLVKSDYITFYLDGKQVWQTPTPPEAYEPLYVMVDLALGGGWPDTAVANPSQLLVDYIRVYAPPPQ